MIIIQKYNDPGHGWARVKRELLSTLGILNEITPFSYQRDQWVYLEEDADMGVLMKALKSKGIAFTVNKHYSHGESKIRSYECFKA